MKDVLSYGIGTLFAFAVVLFIVYVFIQDITQKKHGVLRNYPVIGHLRYMFARPATGTCTRSSTSAPATRSCPTRRSR